MMVCSVLVNVILSSHIFLQDPLHLWSTKEMEIERSPLLATESLSRDTAESSKLFLLALS